MRAFAPRSVLATAGRETLPTLFMYCHFDSMLKVLTTSLAEARHAAVRHSCCVCLLHALRYFGREQFLILRYEDLMSMEAASVLGLLARFTGLSPPAKPTGSRMCQPNGKVSSGARNSYSGTSPRGAEMLNEAAPHLERLFAPYATLLREPVHPHFGWRRSDHYKRPLNATMRARREAEVEGYREHLRKRQANRLMGEHNVRQTIVAAGKVRGGAAGGVKGGSSKAKGKKLRLPEGDVLVTHVPPHGVLDTCYDGDAGGCSSLRTAVERTPRKRVRTRAERESARGSPPAPQTECTRAPPPHAAPARRSSSRRSRAASRP